jgi:hypothetical protein
MLRDPYDLLEGPRREASWRSPEILMKAGSCPVNEKSMGMDFLIPDSHGRCYDL